MLLKIHTLFKTNIKFYEHRLFMVWAVFLFFFFNDWKSCLFQRKIKLKFYPSFKSWKWIILRFRRVHSRIFHDIYASLGRGQEMRAFWTWPLPPPSQHPEALHEGLSSENSLEPLPTTAFLTAPLTLFLHTWPLLN